MWMGSRTSRSAAATCLLIGALAVAACGDDGEESTGAPSTNGGAKTVTLGGLVDLTGPCASYGAAIKNGADLAVEELNAKAGSGGIKFKTTYEDSKCSPEGGISGFRKLVNAGDVTTFLTMGSPVIAAVVPLSEREKSILVDVSATSPAVWLEAPRQYSFSIAPKANDEYTGQAAFAFDTVGAKTAVVLSPDTEAGQATSKFFSDAFQEKGGKVSTVLYKPDAGNFRDYITNATKDNPDLITLAGHADEGGQLALALKESGYKGVILGNTTSVNEKFANTVGAQGDGIVASLGGFDVSSDDPASQQFATTYQEKYGEPATLPSAGAYEAVNLLAQAMAEKGTETDQIATGLRDITFQGPSGTTDIQDNGLVKREIHFKTLKGGKWEPYAE